MTWTYEPADYLSFGGNAAEAAQEALKDGPFGLFWRRDMARAFQACGQNIDLSGIHTTCAVFASAAWHWAGRKVRTRKGHIGGPILNGWLEGLNAPGPYWVPNDATSFPETGDIICYGSEPRLIHHVELSLDKSTDGTILTAHGGDSPTYGELVQAKIAGDKAKIHAANGTVARIGAGRKEMHGICGWFSAAKVAEAEGL